MILRGDCIEQMKTMEENSVDAIVTDPPYGLSFMGKNWDYGVPGEVFFKEMIRVLKPGGFLLAFGGTRTYHRLVCGIEDAGFEIRDCIQWLYGSGFPKSLNIGKQIDKKNKGDLVRQKIIYFRERRNLTIKQLAEKIDLPDANKSLWDWEKDGHNPSKKSWNKIKEVLEVTDDEEKEFEREIIGKKQWTNSQHHFVPGANHSERIQLDETAPATPEAKQWEGWGTALKPANEPICVARKPLSEKNVALNVLKWGTGGINIDATRIGTEVRRNNINVSDNLNKISRPLGNDKMNSKSLGCYGIGSKQKTIGFNIATGRFPANIILECTCDELKEGKEIGNGHFNSKVKMVGKTLYEGGFKDFEQKDRILKEKSVIHTDPNCPCYMLDEQSGNLKSGSMKNGMGGFGNGEKNCFGESEGAKDSKKYVSSKGGASRFFYCAKASKSERNLGCDDLEKKQKISGKDEYVINNICPKHKKQHCECGWRSPPVSNHHPTVKPIRLMEYLIKLVSREGAVVLDPFLGSGTTAIACQKLNRKWIGIEKEEEYVKIAEARLKPYLEQTQLGNSKKVKNG